MTDNFKIAVVGTRKPSDYGKKVAADLGRQLSRAGITVVSGMAKGIDGYAQQASLAVRGKYRGAGQWHRLYLSQKQFPVIREIVENGCRFQSIDPYPNPERKTLYTGTE
ncbi:MAG: DNA-processing protein DprA [Actinomycetota bacterium]|nr:DNA-processing protein DprA [Actinomycetota bacterium]